MTTAVAEAPKPATTAVARKSKLVAIATHYEMEPAAFEATVRETCGCSGATREEFTAFIMVAHEYGLNPLTREIYAFPKKGGGIQPIVGIDGWLRLANEHPQFDGMTVTDNHEGGKLVSATATIYRKDRNHPIVVTEHLNECKRNTDPWKMEHRMLRHKATIQGIRYAFGFAGIMEPDEAEAIVDRDAKPVVERVTPALPVMVASSFETELSKWATLIASGKKTAADIVAMASTRFALTEDQADAIFALDPARVKPDGEIIDAESEPVDRGDAYEEPAAVKGGAA